MSDVLFLKIDGFPFNEYTAYGAHSLRVGLAVLDPRPEQLHALLTVLDEALAFQARYRASANEVEACDRLLRAFSPAGVEESRAKRERMSRYEERRTPPEERDRWNEDEPFARRPGRRAPRPNVFAPERGMEGGSDLLSPMTPSMPDVTLLLTELATARMRAVDELRALREEAAPHLEGWLYALQDGAALLVRAGTAKLSG